MRLQVKHRAWHSERGSHSPQLPLTPLPLLSGTVTNLHDLSLSGPQILRDDNL